MPSKQDGHGRIDSTRRGLLRAIPVAALAAVASETTVAEPAFPKTISLPEGFQPEGIATGRGHEFFVGSIPTGAIYRGDLRTGEGEVLVRAADGRAAIGLSHDDRSNRLFVAGGPTGRAFVYDGTTGETAAEYSLTDPGTFVNDVVVTSSAAYFTDSFRSVLYRIPLGPAGRLPDQSQVEEISLGGDFEAVPGAFNANGIDASPDGTYLVVVNTTTGLLYRVDPATGEAIEIDLGGATLTAGDGILLEETTLYVVRNRNEVIAVVSLDPEATSGTVVGELSDSAFDVPTTIAKFGNALYAVNARFGIENPETAEYTVVRVPKEPVL